MIRLVRFVWLYTYSLAQVILNPQNLTRPNGVTGSAVFSFVDPKQTDENSYGVVAFVLPLGMIPDDYIRDLYGPFGYSSRIRHKGFHLYGRDTWGVATDKQALVNPTLKRLMDENKDHIILLAGVRRLGRWHVWPLNVAANFVLVPKNREVL